MTIIVNLKEDVTVKIVNYCIYKVSVTAALHRCHGFESVGAGEEVGKGAGEA